ncbi:MAG: hypothetical protein KDD67_00300 [Ignavibacteriae bacterium]|nr:hypothetical protein [Ignavibacteriota bacterium]MCB9214723.1 hypothetical protein [Ignavibacteria bacterium]
MAIGLGTIREALEETSVDAIFLRGEADTILERDRAVEDLQKIVKSERGDHRLRVIAQELLMMAGEEPLNKMVRVYCEAIPGAFMHQWWGLPGHHLGRFGETVIKFREQAIPFLVDEMDNSDALTCLGPDAPIARENEYCVGDLAAYMACLILEREYPDGEDRETRNGPRKALQQELDQLAIAEGWR